MGAKYQAYPEYKDSGVEVIGEVPKSWVVGRLKQIVDQNRQITYGIVQAGPNKKGGIPYIRPADMTDEGGVKDYDGLLRTSPEIAADYERSKIKPGDIVCSIGPSFGKLMITPETLDGANLTQGTARVAISSAYNARYFFWALRATSSFQQWESSVGGATFRALNLGPLADTFVVVPSNSEQEKIANFLDHETAKIDTLIEKQQLLIKLLKEKRQAVISHAVTKGLPSPTGANVPMRDSDVEWLGEVPEHWVVSALKHYARIVDCKHITAEFFDEGIPLASISEVKEWHVNLATAKLTNEKYYLDLIGGGRKPEPGDIIYSRNATVGEAALVTENMPKFAMGQDVCLIRLDEAILPEYLLYVLKSGVISNQLDLAMVGSTFKRINVDDIRNFAIALPSYDEQVAIVAELIRILGKYDALVANAEKTIGLMTERRTALISAAVTGKIDVRNWVEPESIDHQNKEVTE